MAEETARRQNAIKNNAQTLNVFEQFGWHRNKRDFTKENKEKLRLLSERRQQQTESEVKERWRRNRKYIDIESKVKQIVEHDGFVSDTRKDFLRGRDSQIAQPADKKLSAVLDRRDDNGKNHMRVNVEVAKYGARKAIPAVGGADETRPRSPNMLKPGEIPRFLMKRRINEAEKYNKM